MKGYKITTIDRGQKYGVAADSLEMLIEKASTKLKVSHVSGCILWLSGLYWCWIKRNKSRIRKKRGIFGEKISQIIFAPRERCRGNNQKISPYFLFEMIYRIKFDVNRCKTIFPFLNRFQNVVFIWLKMERRFKMKATLKPLKHKRFLLLLHRQNKSRLVCITIICNFSTSQQIEYAF